MKRLELEAIHVSWDQNYTYTWQVRGITELGSLAGSRTDYPVGTDEASGIAS